MLARCHVESLNAVSALLKASKAQNSVSETSRYQFLAMEASTSALAALGQAKLWAGPAMASHVAVLRSVGNCISQVPRGT